MAEVHAACLDKAASIRAVLIAAFGGADEADLVAALEKDGDVLASLVVEAGGAIVGHALLSRMVAAFPAAALAPVAVTPAVQGRGYGGALVQGAIAAARSAGCDAVFVLGDPAFYGRFGFSVAAAAACASPYAGPHFMALPLRGELPAGPVAHAPAFGG